MNRRYFKLIATTLILFQSITLILTHEASADILVASGTEIKKLSDDGSVSSTFIPNATYGMYYDSVDQKLYYTGSGDSIRRADRDGTNQTTLVSNAGSTVVDVVIDRTNSKIIWTDYDNAKIRRSDLNGSNVQDLITGVSMPRGLIIDQQAGYIYWAGYNEISRASLDGTGVTSVILDLDGMGGQLSFIAINSGKIYWSNVTQSKIKRANLDGSSEETLASISNATGVQGIAFYALQSNLFYIGQPGAGNVVLRKMNADGSSNSLVATVNGYDVIIDYTTANPTPTPTATATATSTATATITPTPSASATPTASVTATPTATVTITPTITPTATATTSSSPIATPTRFPTAIAQSGFYYMLDGSSTAYPSIYWSDLSLKKEKVLDIETQYEAKRTSIAYSSKRQELYYSRVKYEGSSNIDATTKVFVVAPDGSGQASEISAFTFGDLAFYSALEYDESNNTLYGIVQISDTGAVLIAYSFDTSSSVLLPIFHDGRTKGVHILDNKILWSSGNRLLYALRNDDGSLTSKGLFAPAPTNEQFKTITSIGRYNSSIKGILLGTDTGVYLHSGELNSNSYSKTSITNDPVTGIGIRPLAGKFFNSDYFGLAYIDKVKSGKEISAVYFNSRALPDSFADGRTAYDFVPSDLDLNELKATPTPIPSGTPSPGLTATPRSTPLPTTVGEVIINGVPQNTFGGLLIKLSGRTPTPAVTQASKSFGTNNQLSPKTASRASQSTVLDSTLPCGVALTDKNGRYVFSNIATGEYTITFDRADVTTSVDSLRCQAGDTLPRIAGNYNNLSNNDCTSKDRAKIIHGANERVKSLTELILKNTVNTYTTSQRKISKSKAAILKKFLISETTKIKRSYCKALDESTALPEVVLTCKKTAACKEKKSERSLRSFEKQVNTIERGSIVMLRKMKLQLDKKTRNSVTALETRIAGLASSAKKQANKLPVRTFVCGDM
jgi:hypothetical protein